MSTCTCDDMYSGWVKPTPSTESTAFLIDGSLATAGLTLPVPPSLAYNIVAYKGQGLPGSGAFDSVIRLRSVASMSSRRKDAHRFL